VSTVFTSDSGSSGKEKTSKSVRDLVRLCLDKDRPTLKGVRAGDHVNGPCVERERTTTKGSTGSKGAMKEYGAKDKVI